MAEDFIKDIEHCFTVLQSGGLILYPTDTIWGIGCDATNEKAVEKIILLKHRPPNKSMIILVADEEDIFNYIINPDKKLLTYLSVTEQPTTAIFNTPKKHLAKNLISEDDTIAIRIVKDNFCKMLVNKSGKPIVSTSANISTELFPNNFSEISVEIKNGVDYTVQHRQNDLSSAQPSALIKIDHKGDIIHLR